MVTHNIKSKKLQLGSALAWVLVLVLVISSIVGWYFYMQTEKSLEKNKKQKQRIQQRYNQKSDELYESWNTIQKSNNKNYQLTKQIKSSDSDKNQLTEQLKISKDKSKQLNVLLKQSITQAEVKTHQLNTLLTKANAKSSLLDSKIKQIEADKEILTHQIKQLKEKNQTLAISPELIQMQAKLDDLAKQLSLKDALLEANNNNLSLCGDDIKQVKKQLISQELQLLESEQRLVSDQSEIDTYKSDIDKYKVNFKNCIQLGKNKQQIINNLESKLSQTSASHNNVDLAKDKLQNEKLILQQQLEKITVNTQETINALSQNYDKVSANNDELKSSLTFLGTENQKLKEEVKKTRFGNKHLESELRRIDKLNNEEVKAFKLLKEKLKSEIETKNISIARQKDSSTHIKIGNDLVFKPGQVFISKKGTKILNKISKLLKNFPNRKIEIIGHTDNIPVRSGSHKLILSNWELSAARAGAAIRYLQHAAKVKPERMLLVAASQYQPINKDNNDQARAKNRRIEIRLLPENYSLNKNQKQNLSTIIK